jgi:hypothetical protein
MLEVFKAVADRGSFTGLPRARSVERRRQPLAAAGARAQLGVPAATHHPQRIAHLEGRDVLEARTPCWNRMKTLAASKLGAEETTSEIRLAHRARWADAAWAPCWQLHRRYPGARGPATDRFGTTWSAKASTWPCPASDDETFAHYRRIGEVRLGIFASPAYLKRHGVPQHPSDLSRHHCLLRRRGPAGMAAAPPARAAEGDWPLGHAAPTTATLAAAAVRGSGLVHCPATWSTAPSRAAARSDDRLAGACAGLYLAYASRRSQPVRIRRLIEHLAEKIRQSLDDIDAASDTRLAALAAGHADTGTVEAPARPLPHLAWARIPNGTRPANGGRGLGEARKAVA